MTKKSNRTMLDEPLKPMQDLGGHPPPEVLRAICTLLEYIGEDPNREGLIETPYRMTRSYKELFSGYKKHPADVMKTFSDGACDEMVIVKDISFFSTCEHHWLPFAGKAHIAYIPNGKIIGLSKLPRLLEIYARRLQVQERLTTQITDALMDHLAPKGAGCMIQATHLCMSCRGVQKQQASMITSSLTGVFRTDPATRSEFYSLIRS